MTREATGPPRPDDVAGVLERALACATRGSWSGACAAFASADRLTPLRRENDRFANRTLDAKNIRYMAIMVTTIWRSAPPMTPTQMR